jgi:hypothetical protein
MRNYLDLGNWNALCDSCGRKFKASQLLRRWDGLMVCKHDYETRHPSDFLRVQRERITVPFSRPYPSEDAYTNTCDLWTSSPMADFGVADCATVGGNTNIPLLIDIFNPVAVARYAITGRTIPGVLHT